MSSPTVATGWKGLPAWVLAEAGVTRDGEGLVRVPYFAGDGALHATRVFAPSGRCWWEPAGRCVIPFGLEQLTDERYRHECTLLIAEGESDTLALRAWAAGSPAVDVAGVPGAGCWRAEWSDLLAGYATVFVLGDGDDAGRSFNWHVRADIPHARIVDLGDGDDARAIVQRDPAELDELLARADLMAALEQAVRECRTLDEARAFLEARVGV